MKTASTSLRNSLAMLDDADRFEAWKESGITTMIVGAQQPEALQLLAELTL